uniref:Zinc finger RING-type eukaryotic domain-containing protein n=1 Tax=Callorhinchus milii TaxID=7868 RepID=A0A4W3GBF9_CALMI
MASVQEPENMRTEAARSISLEFYTVPVTADCGHNFCRACTLQSWGTIPQRSVRPNRFVSNIVKSIERLSLNPRLEETGYQCEDHEEKLNLFLAEGSPANGGAGGSVPLGMCECLLECLSVSACESLCESLAL